jgi:GT2 family glycosyltransferase
VETAGDEVRPIDVIVPVHGAGPVFRRCAASLIAHSDGFRADAFNADAIGADGLDAPASGARHRLVIVLDGPPDDESVLAVEELRAAAAREVGGFELEVLTHEQPLGFVMSVNHALRGSDRDAVFLNSDTQVTAGWLGRMRAAAYSDSTVATVTPFSNNATICSLPRFLDENAIPAGYTVDSFGELVTRVSRREYPRLPTGVGFCLYVKRSVLDELGLLDEAFGPGYGEEVDLCLRAARRGYVHVLDDATFIFHEGSRSFGRRREERMRHGERLVLSRYPDYLKNVAEFMKNDPIAPARARVLDELRRVEGSTTGGPLSAAVSVTATNAAPGSAEAAPTGAEAEARVPEGAEGARPLPAEIEALSHGERVWVRGPFPQRVLHLVPGWPPWSSGEAAMSARALMRAQSAATRMGREVFVYARMDDPDRADGAALEYVDGAVRVRLIVANGAPRRTVLSRFGVHGGGDSVGDDFARFLDDVRPQLVHVHDVAGQSLDLLGAARARTIRAALKNVDAFVMGSQSIADRYAAARVLPPSAHVVVSPVPLNEGPETREEIERIYAEVLSPRAK